jgi:hypothetical protein
MIAYLVLTIMLLAMSNERATDAQIRRAAGSQSLEKLQEAVATGWTAEDINQQALTGKSALHMAAWQGCLENIHYLLDTTGCDTDCYSRAEFSYGKSAIFFATTGSRNEVVDLLLDQGAWVKIVNNKGQSILSIASSHLQPQLISKIQEKEKEQQGPWWNFRASHSDGLEYGDLDPRFIDRPLRPEDIVTPWAVNPTTKETRKGGFLKRNPHMEKEAAENQKQPKPKQKAAPSLSDEEVAELEESWKRIASGFERNSEMDLVQDLAKVVRLGDKQRQAWIPNAAETLMESASDDLSRIETFIEASIVRASKREAQLLQKLLQRMLQPDRDQETEANESSTPHSAPVKARPSLDSRPWKEACSKVNSLSMDLLEKNRSSILSLPEAPIWVDSTTKLRNLHERLQTCDIVGVDTEWHDVHNKKAAVATIQIAYQENAVLKAYVVDLIAADPASRKLAQQVVQSLFESDVTVLGFAFGHDVPMLEAFVGHSLPRNFLDLQLLMTADGSSVPGLKACAARFSTTPLSKDEQCSDWARRPLSQSQLDYAGLDAAVLLVLLAEHAKKGATQV